ncbi:MAG: sodium:solute symporter, partial [Verrucomicrobia bacterium]
KVYTAYEYLGQRFDQKTRLLGAFLFLIQRGLAAGITIYAPAIILSALLGWRLNLTIWLAGGLVVAYTAFGGTKIVSITQRYQILIIFVGMALAFIIAVHRLPAGLSFGFNAVVKVPMQFLILLLGAMVFLFYQFEKPPIYFNRPAYDRAIALGHGAELNQLQAEFDDVFARKRDLLSASGVNSASRQEILQLDAKARELRDRAKAVLERAGASPKSKDSDYVFITFVLQHLPHGVVGLLIAVILCATMSATAATLNALGSTSAVDFYRPLIRPNAPDHHYVVATELLTIAWGLVAIGVASYASLVENLIETGNILGSIFYGSILGLFLVAFFLRSVRGSAVFFAALLAQCLVLILFWTLSISYLWYNLIGCAAVLVFSLALQRTIFAKSSPA